MSLAANILEFPVPSGDAVPSGFAHLPDSILTDTQLPPAQRIYWAVLAGHVNKAGIAFPGEERLGRLLGCTARQIRTYNTALVARGLITVHHDPGSSNRYRLPQSLATEGNFTRVSRKVLYDATLSVGARLAYAVVVYYQRQDHECLHSISAMAKLAGIPKTTFKKWITELRRVGLIEVTRHKREAAGRHATITAGKKSSRPQRTSLRRDKHPKSALDGPPTSGVDGPPTSGVDGPPTSGVDGPPTSAERNPVSQKRNPMADANAPATDNVTPRSSAKQDSLLTEECAPEAHHGAGAAVVSASASTLSCKTTKSSSRSRGTDPSTKEKKPKTKTASKDYVPVAYDPDVDDDSVWCAKRWLHELQWRGKRVQRPILEAWQDICWQWWMAVAWNEELYEQFLAYLVDDPYFRENRSWLHKNPQKMMAEFAFWWFYTEHEGTKRRSVLYQETGLFQPPFKYCVGCNRDNDKTAAQSFVTVGQQHNPGCPLRSGGDTVQECDGRITDALARCPEVVT